MGELREFVFDMNRWSVSVQVAESERRHLTISPMFRDGPVTFETQTLRVHNAMYRDEPAAWSMSGPNVKKDGTTGKLSHSGVVGEDEVLREYPLTFAAVQEALTELKVRIDAQARRVLASVSREQSAPEQARYACEHQASNFTPCPRGCNSTLVSAEMVRQIDVETARRLGLGGSTQV